MGYSWKSSEGVIEMPVKPLPLGIDDFRKLITDGYYYVDKTWLIKELLDKKGEVNLFTRPRRFGKTLNLSMLRYFFEHDASGDYAALFQGKRILDAGEAYTAQMGKYAVIFLTLKSGKQPDFHMAYTAIKRELAYEYKRHMADMDLDRLGVDKERFLRIATENGNETDYMDALKFLSYCLAQYYKLPVIILIDEYDVPLENAYYAGFYDQMVEFIRSLFESALKTNPYLAFSVITGCLRLSRESILNENYGEYFGFLEEEVQEMLRFYHREQKMDTMRQWYNGYLFGESKVYNPWSVLHYTEQLVANVNAFPTAAWSNTSSNSIIRDLIYHSTDSVREEIENLINGKTIDKKVHEDITYGDIYGSEDNLWNFLYFTGYLKRTGKYMVGDDIYLTLAIPNREVNAIYRDKVSGWFRDEVKVQDLSVLYSAMLEQRTDVFGQELRVQLQKTISYMDSEEAFYHGFLLGIMANLDGYRIKSNREAGDGRYDICIYSLDVSKAPVILELKVAEKYKNLEQAADQALAQINDKHYDAGLEEEGYTEVIHYGIAFYKKQVFVKSERKTLPE